MSVWANYIQAADGSVCKLGWFYITELDEDGLKIHRVSKEELRKAVVRSERVFGTRVLGQYDYGFGWRHTNFPVSTTNKLGWSISIGCKYFDLENAVTLRKWLGL